MIKAIDKKTVDAALEQGRKQTRELLSHLGELQPAIDALYTPIGQMLLTESIKRANELFVRFIKKGLSEEEQVELRVISKQLMDWANRVDIYNKGISELERQGSLTNKG